MDFIRRWQPVKKYNPRLNLNYSNIKEMILSLEDILEHGQKIVDGWQEGKYYILVVQNVEGRDFRVKFKIPV